MNNLSFHNILLQFYSKEDEEQYEFSLNDKKEKYFRIMSLFYGCSFLILVIINLAENNSYNVTIIGASVFGTSLILFAVNFKFKKIINLLFILLFLLNITQSLYLEDLLSSNYKFIHGYNSCFITCVFLHQIRYKFRISLLIGLVFVQLGILQLYGDDNIQIILLSILATLFKTYHCYSIEFYQRQIFDLNSKLQHQKNILHSCTGDKIIVTSFDINNQSFNLDFCNQASNKSFNIQDDKSLQNFLRICLVVPNDKNIESVSQRSSDAILKRLMVQKISLEEKLFSKLQNFNEELEVTVIYEIKVEQYRKLTLLIQRYSNFKPVFVIIVKKNDIQQIMDSHNKSIKSLQQMIQVSYSTILLRGLNLSKAIEQLNIQNITTSSISVINYFNLSLQNQLNNIQLFLEIDKVYRSQQQNIKNFSIESFLNDLIPKLQMFSRLNNKQFDLQNELRNDQRLNLNLNFLTSIFINLFEYCLKIMNHTDIFTLRLKHIQNPKYIKDNINNLQYYNNNGIIPIIKLCFSFFTQEQIILEPKYFKLEECRLGIINQFSFNYFITTTLLDILGPTNIIKCTQRQLFSNNQYLNKICCYIYTDQQQLDPSYSKYNRYNLFQNIFSIVEQ